MPQPKDTDGLNGFKNKSHTCAALRDLLQFQGHTQTESERMEDNIPCKQKSKKSWSSNTHISKIDLKTILDKEGHYMMIKGSIQEEDIYRIFHPKVSEYTFFSSAHGTFSRIGHILGHKTSPGKF